jgi:hypothetical protein
MTYRANLTVWSLPLLLFLCLKPTLLSAVEFQPGQPWLDVAGQPIQAHGGGVLARGSVFYWYGEDRTPGGPGGVACYASTNLFDWKKEGLALSRESLPQTGASRGFVERPKVIFNTRNGQYVMWMHLEQRGYNYARAGIATSASPAGPFTFVKAIRPITNGFGFKEADRNRQKEFGGTVRDMNLFVDDDGKAYVFYASEDNATMYVVRLADDYLGPEEPAVETKTWARILVGRMREAPAPFKHGGRYGLITSGCTGWKPNEADCAVADHILGPWQSKGNPCAGPEAKTSFRAQSTCVLPVPGRPGSFIFMADRWEPQRLAASSYIWLPFTLKPDGSTRIDWRDRWDISAFPTE